MPPRFWSIAPPGPRTTAPPASPAKPAMAKLFATDRAQEVIDKAVQLHGGDGVRSGHVVERLYREIRALRIYEGRVRSPEESSSRGKRCRWVILRT